MNFYQDQYAKSHNDVFQLLQFYELLHHDQTSTRENNHYLKNNF